MRKHPRRYTLDAIFSELADEAGSTANKAKLACVGAIVIVLGYGLIFGMGTSKEAWEAARPLFGPGICFAAPYGYDALTTLLRIGK